jgi:hypothetical protein
VAYVVAAIALWGGDGGEMMRSGCRLVFALIFVYLSLAAAGAERWIVRGSSSGAAQGCVGLRWNADAILHNRTDQTSDVRLLHVSNGGDGANFPASIPAHSSATLSSTGLGGVANSNLWVVKVQVPEALVTEGRLESFNADLCNPGHPPALTASGKVPLPVFASLAPAGAEQVHYGTDLGGQAVRLNVAIYNASDVPASAVISVIQPLCVAAPVTAIGLVPSDSIVQIQIPEVKACSTSSGLQAWASYVTVSVDQPSLSFVSAIANGVPTSVTHGVVP